MLACMTTTFISLDSRFIFLMLQRLFCTVKNHILDETLSMTWEKFQSYLFWQKNEKKNVGNQQHSLAELMRQRLGLRAGTFAISLNVFFRGGKPT